MTGLMAGATVCGAVLGAGLWLFLFHAVSLCSLIGGGRWLLEG